MNAFLSPAVDYCDESPGSALQKDINFEDRGWDGSSTNNHFEGSFYDIGADETYGNDVIFKNGIEEL